ncbi:hypothetical protein BXZ70DRAFT_1005324 [Cristinia sonorae]|uniref:DUF6534 domain-containing protein n=1 Tax=Cristinia sonorae TaxID=1940300 RepID=A0A8K0XT66_9AGAR|nr:hypothetical protein BXZ70DRAFT_1005324 [Cristinia sonorae]
MDLGPVYGAALVGIVIEGTLFGVTLLQTYTYYKHYPEDSLTMKLLVGILTALDSLHLIFCIRSVYWYLVINFGRWEILDEVTWTSILQADVNGLIGIIVQYFFTRRLWKMSNNWFLAAILSSEDFTLAWVLAIFTAYAFKLGKFSSFGSLTWITCTGLGSAAAADVIIAIAMVYYLSQKRTGIESTDSLVSTLMVYSVNTGLLTSILATSSVILFLTMQTNQIWMVVFWIMGKCYVNSFLASLNSREGLRNIGNGGSGFEMRRRDQGPGVYMGKKVCLHYHRVYRVNHADAQSLIQPSGNPLAVAIETRTEFRTDFDALGTKHNDQGWSPTSSAVDVPIQTEKKGSSPV